MSAVWPFRVERVAASPAEERHCWFWLPEDRGKHFERVAVYLRPFRSPICVYFRVTA